MWVKVWRLSGLAAIKMRRFILVGNADPYQYWTDSTAEIHFIEFPINNLTKEALTSDLFCTGESSL